MMRLLGNFAAAVSLGLCLAAMVLGARSYFWSHGASIGWRAGPGEAGFVSIYSGRGGIQLCIGREAIDGDIPSLLHGRAQLLPVVRG